MIKPKFSQGCTVTEGNLLYCLNFDPDHTHSFYKGKGTLAVSLGKVISNHSLE